MSRKLYGAGCIVRPKGRKYWRIEYWHNGRRFVQSSRSEDRSVANRLLNAKRKELGLGTPVDGAVER